MSVTSFSAVLLKKSMLVLGQQDFYPAPSLVAVSFGCDVREDLFQSFEHYELADWFRAAIGSGYSRNVRVHSGATDVVWGQKGFAITASLSKQRRGPMAKKKQFVVPPPIQAALRAEGQRLIESIITDDDLVPEDERMRSTRLLVFALLAPTRGHQQSPFLERFVDALQNRFSGFDLRRTSSEVRPVQNAPGWAALGYWGVSRAA